MDTPFVSGTDRQRQILRLLEARRRLSVSEICATFSVSEATARRDLEILAEEGRVQRVRGGALPLQEAPPELPMLERQGEQQDEKDRIGQAAAALVADGETVFLGSGTTVLAAARQLRQRCNLTVITNSLPVVNALAGQASVICLGGMLRESELSFIGHITEQSLAEVRADKVLIGTRAVSLEHGLTHEYLPETMTDRAILQAGREIVVLADHTKLGRSAAVRLAPLEGLHTLVTDRQAPADFLQALQRRGVRVVTA